MLGGIFGPSTAKTQSLHIFECGLIRHLQRLRIIRTASQVVETHIEEISNTNKVARSVISAAMELCVKKLERQSDF